MLESTKSTQTCCYDSSFFLSCNYEFYLLRLISGKVGTPDEALVYCKRTRPLKDQLLARDLQQSSIIVPSRERGGNLNVMKHSPCKGIHYSSFIVEIK